MQTDTIKYAVLEVLAAHDHPMTCAEIFTELPEANRPKPKDAEEPRPRWSNLTSHTATLYAGGFVDRRKRDVENKPFEYWLAAAGVEELASNDDLPEQVEETEPQPDDLLADDAVAETEMNGEYLGADIEDIDSPEQLNDVLVGLCDSVMEIRESVDHLREDAVREEELARIREDARKAQGAGDRARHAVEKLEDEVDRLNEQLRDIGVHEDHAFALPVRQLHALQNQGYGVYEYEHEISYGGKIHEVTVKAKPADKCDYPPNDTTDDAPDDDA